MIVTVAEVLDYLKLNAVGSTSQYSAATVGSNIQAATEQLERATRRYFLDRPASTLTWTSEGRAILPIPGLRTATTVTNQGATVQSSSYWLLPDVQQTGVYTGIQFRTIRQGQGGVWWYGDPNWFDRDYDNPFYPPNYGGGLTFSSTPNDTTILGDWGYAAGTEPYAVRHAVKVLAAFYTMRPASLLADVAITPAGGVLNYSQMPAEVQDFVRAWSVGAQAVSVG